MKQTAWLMLVLLTPVVALNAGCRRGRPDKAPLVIASKDFGESELLAEIIAQTIEAQTEIPVIRRMRYGDTFTCYRAITSHAIDVYPEYSGTAYAAVFKLAGQSRDAATVRAAVEHECRKRGLVWSTNFGFDDTFAIVVREEDARRMNLAKISDLVPVASGWRLGFGYEFAQREDGYSGLVNEYDLHFKNVKTMNLEEVYDALRAQRSEAALDVAIGNSTDGQQATSHLFQLRDDRHYFPPYEAGVITRADVLNRNQEVGNALRLLTNRFSPREIQIANAGLQLEKRAVGDVACELLRRKRIRR